MVTVWGPFSFASVFLPITLLQELGIEPVQVVCNIPPKGAGIP